MAVVGARPNFMKVAPIWREMDKTNRFAKFLLHTGQHYDANMSKIFFEDLKLPEPDAYLGVGSGTHAEQTGRIMIALDDVLLDERPDLVMVVGDVNSTMAAALVAVKHEIPVAHVEAGLRSFDRSMPEEINRMVTDIVAELLFTTCSDAEKNLLREGVDPQKIHFVGNVMIDSLHYYKSMAESSRILENLALEKHAYGLVTIHRPTNVDDVATLQNIIDALLVLGEECPLIFPVHPRTRKIIDANDLEIPPGKLRLIEPIGYLDFIKLMKYARILLTDSGGIQEETTALGIPCLTIRENTERPITIEMGTNRLVGMVKNRIVDEGRKALRFGIKDSRIPDLWDGKASVRIVKVFETYFS
ncbi:MAG: UDP-N-acetylglucosamine 2-epimerase (non-hydrolyzing) [Candidatus Latescibacteria bacterium]|nr:UDP-N-acetylglucosamine 2-epimerase (non-hydrolyzing) [Candidatus Latescibacterota bacterium]NIM22318.1 UDP-N-acetylglucosamine 2-epimerase (non-hydrolyzing) [Candidatus Latescibacterota bacterium]NIM66147.1 UDP-N-acetylglucosamine 2-epimerase (non-hydrolyzing) [Candidatus Latescibacterota bacterium]NIO02555.1 UDP-N-acetylglucosamine 2-epimerase (non-hydrolyzing) [Candidatus Latescibacterota bacterium]NIO29469.1 UDP-N-acetylglucosamine 2-epimerase (non-hydrolyzing) [Candidatus Latescibactero